MKTIIAALLVLPNLLLGEMTFSMIKPTAVQEQKAGEIIAQLQASGLRVVALKITKMTPEQADIFYKDLKDKPFFPELSKMMTSGPVVAMVLDGDNAVAKTRELIGPTDPKEAKPTTIRARFGKSKGDNAIHASDSVVSAEREIPIFFSGEEIFLSK